MARERTLIIGASGGIGRALLECAGGRGTAIGLSRSVDGLDVTDEASVASHLATLDGDFDRIIISTGGLSISGSAPEKSLSAIDPAAMEAQFRLNALGPALVLKHLGSLIPKDRRSVIAVLSARVGSIGDNQLGGWISYRSAKAALNQIVRTASIEYRRTRKQAICVAIHPGTVQTDLTRKYLARHPAVAPIDAAQNIMNVLDVRSPEDTGQFFDWAGKPVPW